MAPQETHKMEYKVRTQMKTFRVRKYTERGPRTES